MSIQDTGQHKMYRPYVSDNESETNSSGSSSSSRRSSSDESDSWFNTRDGPNFQALAANLNSPASSQLLYSQGAEKSTISQSVSEIYSNLGKSLLPDVIKKDKKFKTSIFNTEVTKNTALMNIDSQNRDKKVFKQPTYCVIRFPRVYKNVTSITVPEIKLLTSIFVFSKTNGNTDITIYEKDRTSITNGVSIPLKIKSYIHDGSYNISDLLKQIQLQLNIVPIFYDYINGFNDFIAGFNSSGDFSLVFNQPGDFFYDINTQEFIPNPTLDSITTYFWISRYANLSSYSTTNTLIAYYYPVLKYYLLSTQTPDNVNLISGLNIDPVILTIRDVVNRCLYTFQGLDDPVVLAVINANIAFLDSFRLQNTFRNSLVNNYTITVNPQSQGITFSSSGLNTSLQTLLNLQKAKYTNQALSNLSYTGSSYSSLIASNSQFSALSQDMFNYYQAQFATYFAVPYNQYSISYYMTISNFIYIRNGANTINIPSNSAESVNAGVITLSNSPFNNTSSITYWPNLTNLTNTIEFTNLNNATSSFNFVYNPSLNSIDTKTPFINSNNVLYSQRLTDSATVICPITAAKYTVFKFASPVRQTIEIQTLPRPTLYRLPLYNKSNFDSNINKYFNMPYNFTSNISHPSLPNYTIRYDNIRINSLIQIPGWVNNTTWGNSYKRSLSLYTIPSRLTVIDANGSLFFQFKTPSSTIVSSYTYSLNLTVSFFANADELSTITNPANDYTAFIYHDRAAFMGDSNANNTRNENPYFYKYKMAISTIQQNNTLEFTTYPNQTYYVTVRPNIRRAYTTAFIAVIPWFSSNFKLTTQTSNITGLNPSTDVYLPNFSSLITTNFNYSEVYDPSWIQLPITSSLLNVYNPSTIQLITSNIPIGYDINNISTDFIDYVPYNINIPTQTFYPSGNFGMDPINNYVFQYNSPLNGTYFYPDADNFIMSPRLKLQYTPETVLKGEKKIVHYYSVTYIPESDLNIHLFDPKLITNTTDQLPYNSTITEDLPIPGYSYSASNGNLQLDRGVLGFTFIPGKGTWNLKKFIFRTAITDYVNDPNQYNTYLGIYLYCDIINTNTSNLYLSNALIVLSNSARVTYTSNFTEITYGFDPKGGTYYEYSQDSSFSTNTLLGFSQNPDTMINQPESMYACVTFTSNGIPNTIKALSGSAVPYPYYNKAFVSTSYLDGTKSYIDGQGVVFPSTIGQNLWPFETANSNLYAPTPYASQSAYINSQPIGTSVIVYKNYINYIANTNFLKEWKSSVKPTTINPNVIGYMLIQDTQINIYKYDSYNEDYNFRSPIWRITVDTIFNNFDNTTLIAFTANDFVYFFLGITTTNGISRLRLKQFDPANGEIVELQLDQTFQISPRGTVKSFTINNFNQLVLIYHKSDSITEFYYTITDFKKSKILKNALPEMSTATHSMDTDGSKLYWLQTDNTLMGNQIYQWDLNTPFPGNLYTYFDKTLYWNQIAMTIYSDIPTVNDRLYLTNTISSVTNTIYYTSLWYSNSFTLDIINKSTFTIQSINTGNNGSFWATDVNNSVIWGNRNQQVDIPGNISGAWQIFYPFQKIILERIDKDYNPMTDLKNIAYPEYPHTQLFYYSNETNFIKDTFKSWGNEKTASRLDTKFSGYYFNSHISQFPIAKSFNFNDFQYIVVRGFTPTENSETLLRFIVPNRYTFGYVNTDDLINEINTSNTSNFDIEYVNTLNKFNKSFNQSVVFGANIIPRFNGELITTTNFSDFYRTLSTTYYNYNETSKAINYVNTYINNNMITFISTQLKYILPQSALLSQTYTSPLLFSILWNSSLLPQYKGLIDNWGLGYNLGFTSMDTPLSVIHKSSSFYKIISDYLYLRLSPEYNINTLDITEKEDLTKTRDSTGSIQEYFGKLLLGDFNTYSRTFVSNQVTFNPPVAKLDKLSFEWLTSAGVRLDNNDCEWNASLAITEYTVTATADSTFIPQKVVQEDAAPA
jgi:hypothetical protein